ncbi:hypothetical protein FACS1894217_08080 [Clostridia bacterium]|nr:hypothetical protein FACS1894217_08080 [Clostridia bacterium]
MESRYEIPKGYRQRHLKTLLNFREVLTYLFKTEAVRGTFLSMAQTEFSVITMRNE